MTWRLAFLFFAQRGRDFVVCEFFLKLVKAFKNGLLGDIYKYEKKRLNRDKFLNDLKI